jgi:hypothetical protein
MPELLAEAPNQVWSWDIAKLMGPAKWSYFYLYVILDIFSCRFFDWYNRDHHHAGIGLMTPDQVHYGRAAAVHTARHDILTRPYQANPERFVRKTPEPPPLPTATWINPPQKPENIQA